MTGNKDNRGRELTDVYDFKELGELHQNCRRGDHYLGIDENFTIIFKKKGTFRVTADLITDRDGKEYPLHDNCRDGIFYFGSMYSMIGPVHDSNQN